MAHLLKDRFADGIVFADLTRADSPDQALAILTAAMGLRERIAEGRSQVQVLARHLSGRTC